MSRQEETVDKANRKSEAGKQRLTSKRVSDHLANERTFLAWTRTGLATITFGFVVQRFGLLLRQLGLKNTAVPTITLHYSAVIGIGLTILGVIMIIVSLVNFLQIRNSIDKEDFHPQAGFAIVLTVLASIIGITLVFYLFTSD